MGGGGGRGKIFSVKVLSKGFHFNLAKQEKEKQRLRVFTNNILNLKKQQ